jgi:hypothetical protein
LNNCGVLTGKPAESQACTVVQPTITVTSLNGGETLTQGQTYNITWTSTGLGSQAGTISLIGGSLQNIGITGSVPLSAGTYSWTVPTQYYTLGSNFKIFIDNGNNSPGVNDYSDNYFSIVAPVATCTDSDVTTAYPDGKDYFTKGTATDKYGTYTDLCYAATNQVFEYYCDPTLGYSKGVYYTCPNGCADGACKPATYGLNTQAQAIASLLDAYAQLISYLKNTPSQ